MTTPDPNPIYTSLVAEKDAPAAPEPATTTETTATTTADTPADGTSGTMPR